MGQPLIRTNASSFDVDITPGTYPMTCTGVKLITINVKGESKDVYEWAFLALNAQGNEVELTGLTGLATGPKSRTWAYLEALLGSENVGIDMDFEESDVIGHSALGTMAVNQQGNLRLSGLVPMPRGMQGPAVGRPAATVSPIRQKPAAQTVRGAVAGNDDDDLPF